MMYGRLEESSHFIGEDFKQYALYIFSEGQGSAQKKRGRDMKKEKMELGLDRSL